MTLRIFSLFAVLAALVGCTPPVQERSNALHPIHYSLDLAGPGQPDSAWQAAWQRILDRLQPESELIALLPDTRQAALLTPLVGALRRSGAGCRLLVAPGAWVGDTTDARDSLAAWHGSGLLQCINVTQVLPPFELQQGALFAFRGLRPTLQDDGAYSLAICGITDSDSGQVRLVLAVHGDPGLVSAVEAYWEGLHAAPHPNRLSQTETFTDVYQHTLHYYPLTNAEDPFLGLITGLDSGLTHLTRPARLRILAPHGMAEPLQEGLYDLLSRHEIDLLLLWGAADSLETALAFGLFGKRIRPIAVGGGTPLVLIDGPFANADGDLPQRRRLLLLGQLDFLHAHDGDAGGLVLQLGNEVLFNRADQQWRSLWEM